MIICQDLQICAQSSKLEFRHRGVRKELVTEAIRYEGIQAYNIYLLATWTESNIKKY